MSRWILLLLAAALAGLSACGEATADDRARPDQQRAEPLGGPPPEALELGRAPVAPTIPDDAPIVAFLGDSITAGLHLPADAGFPAAVQRLLAERALPFHVVLAGVSGDTSAGGLSRIGWVLRSSPDVVVIELGGNDGLRGKPVSEIRANLAAIVGKVRDAGGLPLLVGMQLPGNYGSEYTRAFSGLYESLATELDVPLVPHFMNDVGGRPDLMLPDGIHPTPAGHEKLAEALAPRLEAVLDELAALRG